MSGQQGQQPAADATARLQQAITVSVEAGNAGLKDFMTTQIQALQIQIGELQVQVRTLTKAFEEGGAAKPKGRTKKAAEPTPGAVVTPGADAAAATADAAAPATTAAAAPPDAGEKKFPPNAYNWFMKKFKEDAAFRARYLTPAALDLMKNDELIQKRKTDSEKIAPQSKFLWTHYRANDPATHKELNAQFEAERDANKAGKPVQQTKEAATPETQRK
jgi:hypothetical protein